MATCCRSPCRWEGSVSDWIERLRERTVGEVATAGGLEVQTSGIGPCPVCGAGQRSSSDRRPPINVKRNGRSAWHCWGCTANGDSVSLAAAIVTGTTQPALWGEVASWAEDELPTVSVVPKARAVVEESEPRRPPTSEVSSLWDRCRHVTDDKEVCDWLDGRGLNPGIVDDFDLARVIPTGMALPAWAQFGRRPWTRTGHRLVVPMVDETGCVRSLHARTIYAVPKGIPKALSPKGYSVAGLVMANDVGRQLLSGQTPDDPFIADLWKPPSRAIVVEGVPDWLTWVTRWGDACETVPAVIGVISGSWSDDLAERFPPDLTVTLRTHDDTAGRRYALQVAKSLIGRCRVEVPKESSHG